MSLGAILAPSVLIVAGKTRFPYRFFKRLPLFVQTNTAFIHGLFGGSVCGLGGAKGRFGALAAFSGGL